VAIEATSGTPFLMNEWLLIMMANRLFECVAVICSRPEQRLD